MGEWLRDLMREVEQWGWPEINLSDIRLLFDVFRFIHWIITLILGKKRHK